MEIGNTKVDVAIVGAGFSGLSAALALRDAGQNVLVLEAQNRPGGRVWTVIGEDGHACEKGRPLFAADMTQVYDLVKKYGLTRRYVRKVPGVVALLAGRRQILETDFLEHDFFERLLSEATDPNRPGSVLDWVMTLDLDADRIAMIKSGCEEVIGRPIQELSFRSVLDCLRRFENFENTMEFCCREGLGTLTGLMAADLGTSFRANAPVSAVGGVDGLFRLTTPQGAVTASQMIFAAEPAVLRNVRWTAPQDQWLNAHGDHFVAGKMRKIVMRHNSAFWLGSGYGWLSQTDTPSGLSVMDASDSDGGLDVLAVFCDGTAAMAMEGLSDDQVLAKVIHIIEPMLGPRVRNPVAVIQTNWTGHSWVGGGYDTWANPGTRIILGRRCIRRRTGCISLSRNWGSNSPVSSKVPAAGAVRSPRVSCKPPDPFQRRSP